MSIFVIWHFVAIVIIGPFSSSYLHNNLVKIYRPYLTLTHLERSWSFYAPPPMGSILRYKTISKNAVEKNYPLTPTDKKFSHSYFRYTNFYYYLFYNPRYIAKRGYDRSVTRFLCDKHKSEGIIEIVYVLLKQKSFSYKDFLNGKKATDKEFLAKTLFGPYKCE